LGLSYYNSHRPKYILSPIPYCIAYIFLESIDVRLGAKYPM
jgi:hypothetical protein